MPSHSPSDALVVASRQIHDAFFRAICSDPARVDALIRAHWPPALRWLLRGESARPAYSEHVLGNLGQLRADGVFLVGGEGRRARAATILKGKSTVDFRTPGQSGGYLGAVQAQLVGTGCELVLVIAFHTGPDAWNVPGVIREAGCSLREILCQMTWRNTYFQRQTRDIPYHDLAPDNSVLRAMLGMHRSNEGATLDLGRDENVARNVPSRGPRLFAGVAGCPCYTNVRLTRPLIGCIL